VSGALSKSATSSSKKAGDEPEVLRWKHVIARDGPRSTSVLFNTIKLLEQRIRQLKSQHAASMAERDQAIRRLAAKVDWSYQEIADVFGVGWRTVDNAVNGKPTRSHPRNAGKTRNQDNPDTL
jgi:hypothetical protein